MYLSIRFAEPFHDKQYNNKNSHAVCVPLVVSEVLCLQSLTLISQVNSYILIYFSSVQVLDFELMGHNSLASLAQFEPP